MVASSFAGRDALTRHDARSLVWLGAGPIFFCILNYIYIYVRVVESLVLYVYIMTLAFPQVRSSLRTHRHTSGSTNGASGSSATVMSAHSQFANDLPVSAWSTPQCATSATTPCSPSHARSAAMRRPMRA